MKMQLWFRHKLMIGSFLILVFSILFGVYCLQTVRNLSTVVQLTHDALTASTFAQTAKFDFARFDQEVTESLRSSTPNFQKYHLELANQFAQAAKSDIQTVASREISDDDQVHLKLALTKIGLLDTYFKKLSQSTKPREVLVGEWLSCSLRNEIYNNLTTVAIASTELGLSYRDEAHVTSATARQTIFTLVVCTAAIIFGVVLLLLTTALPPLKTLTEACGDIAKGKLFRRAEIKSNDEFGLLSQSFNLMIERIEVKDRNLASLLGAIPEAIFFFDRSGALSKESSTATTQWFESFKKTPDITGFFVKFLGQDSEKINKILALIWSAQTHAHPETIFELLPASGLLEIQGETLHLRFRYRAQYGFNHELERVIVVAQNISSEVLAEQRRIAQENHVTRILNLTTLGFGRSRQEFDRQIAEISLLCDSEHGSPPSDYLKRILHGFKGSLSVLGFQEVGTELHKLETLLEADPINDAFGSQWLKCQTLLNTQMEQLAKILKTTLDEENVQLSKSKVDHLTELAMRIDDGELTTLLETLKSVDLGDILAKYRNYVKTVSPASHLGKNQLAHEADEQEFESGEKAIELHLNLNKISLPPDLAAHIDAIVGHLIRNAIDHGLEPKWERNAVGKSETGAITIHAKIIETLGQEPQLELNLSDDGRGVHVENLKMKAVRKGIWTEDQAENATLQQAMILLFLPNFTTREDVTEISGRGVGLDAVKAMIERLGGGLAIQSKFGYGTRFKFQVPIRASQNQTASHSTSMTPTATTAKIAS